MMKQWPQLILYGHAFAYLLVTTRSDDNDECPGSHACSERFIGGRVARVQCDEHVQPGRAPAVNGACLKVQAFKLHTARHYVAEIHEFPALLHSRHLGFVVQVSCQVIIECECQVSLSA